MESHLKHFITHVEYEAYISGEEAVLPNVSICDDEPGTVHYNPFWEPLCFTAEQSGSTVHMKKYGEPTPNDFEISTDGKVWNPYVWEDELGATITLSNVGDKVYFRNTSETTKAFSIDDGNEYNIYFSGLISASGDITSLLRKSGKVDTIPNEYCFADLFNDFNEDFALLRSDELKLPSTTLSEGCYSNMFNSCARLTTAPALPATTLTDSCYSGMFSGCSNLNYIKCLAIDISASGSHNAWVAGVASTGTFVKSSGISETSWGRGVNGIPEGWTIIDN